jgi:hypothetical protein
MGIFDKIGEGLAALDPTTTDGLVNLGTAIGTGGLSAIPGFIDSDLTPDKLLSGFDDSISGQDQKEAAKAAAQAQESAAQSRLGLDTRIYEEGQTKLDPFYEGGLGSLDQYLGLIDPEGAAQFKADYLQGEEFQSILDQGTNQIASNAAFSGDLGSGGTLKAVSDYATDQSFNLSNQALQQELSRLGMGVGLSQGAANSQITAGQNFGQSAGQAYTQMGNAQATERLAGAPSGIAPYLNLAGTAAQIYGATV